MKDDWHKYMFELDTNQTVTLRLTLGTDVIFERSCTVHRRALEIGYIEIYGYGPTDPPTWEEEYGPFPPGPDARCACGTQEFGDARNATQCNP